MASANSHQSFFTYNLSRPYPFRWFTPVVVLAFILATGIFSLFNLAANGYVLVNHVSTNPNITVTHGTWFTKWPSFFIGNNQAKCQPAMISNMATVFTNNTALTYTIAGITQSGTESILDSLEYNNNVIGDCSISSIDVDLQGVTVRSSKQFAFTQWGTVTTAYVTCSVAGAQGSVILNMTTTYDYVLDSTPLTRVGTFLGTAFIERNRTRNPNLWWGESLMSLHWDSVSGTMEGIQNANTQSGNVILKGIISFTKTNETDDITNLGFFTVDYRFTVDMEDGTIGIIYPGDDGYTNDIAALRANASSPDIWIETDSLVKSMYSTVLTDLGQTNANANILKDQNLLRQFLSGASETLNMAATYNAVPGPATRDDYINGTSINILTPNIDPSVISASYICQIPKRKSTGNLLLSVIVADLVFLNALWLIFKLIVDHFFLQDRDHTYFRVDKSSAAADPLGQDRATLLSEAGNTSNYLSPYATQKSGFASNSALASVSNLGTPRRLSDLFEGDAGYVLTTMNDVDDGFGSTKRSRKPF